LIAALCAAQKENSIFKETFRKETYLKKLERTYCISYRSAQFLINLRFKKLSF